MSSEKFDAEKWENGWKPTYKPDWRENGTIHLDGEKDFAYGAKAEDVIESFQNICEQVGGLCTHQPEENQFRVTSQYVLRYTLHYDDDGEITEIDLEDEGEFVGTYPVDELVEYHEEVVAPMLEAIEKGDVEWTIEKQTDQENISPLADEEDEN